MTIRQLSIFVENRSGGLADVTGLLASANIDIRALSIADTSDFGILRLIVDNPTKAAETLSSNDFIVSITEVIAVKMDDAPGGLARTLRVLSDAGVDMEYIYAFVSRSSGSAYVVLRVADNDKTVEILKNNGITVASPEEIYVI